MKYLALSCASVALITGLPKAATTGSAKAGRTASFSRDVFPILTARCLPCHGGDQRIRGGGNFYVTSYAAIMRGGANGKVITPRHPERSDLIRILKAHDDSRMPPVPYDPLDLDKIHLLERWISLGAQADAATPMEHEIELSDIDPRFKERVWVSCRTPVNGYVRLQISDPTNGHEIDTMCWPAEAGRWAQWTLPYRDPPPVELAWPGKVKLTLFIDLQTPTSSPMGTIFVVTYGPKPKEADLQTTYGRVAISPDPVSPPKHATATFTYWLDVESDINYEIWSERSVATKPLFEGLERDAPSGENHVTWKLLRGKSNYPVGGWYTARFRAKSRVPDRAQPDFAILFKVTPSITIPKTSK